MALTARLNCERARGTCGGAEQATARAEGAHRDVTQDGYAGLPAGDTPGADESPGQSQLQLLDTASAGSHIGRTEVGHFHADETETAPDPTGRQRSGHGRDHDHVGRHDRHAAARRRP